MIREVEMYTVDCDRCEANADEGGEYTAWEDTEGAVHSADDAGWLITDDGKHYCGACWRWSDDGEHKVPLPPTPGGNT